MNNLPDNFFLIGDMAYPCSNKLLTPYPGTNLSQRKIILNYYLSQIRVKIEQAFGFMTNKWQILENVSTPYVHLLLGQLLSSFLV